MMGGGFAVSFEFRGEKNEMERAICKRVSIGFGNSAPAFLKGVLRRESPITIPSREMRNWKESRRKSVSLKPKRFPRELSLFSDLARKELLFELELFTSLFTMSSQSEPQSQVEDSNESQSKVSQKKRDEEKSDEKKLEKKKKKSEKSEDDDVFDDSDDGWLLEETPVKSDLDSSFEKQLEKAKVNFTFFLK